MVNMTGKRIGMLTVLRIAPKTRDTHRSWVCRCDCGVEKTINGGNLRKGNAVSCGCRQGHRTHGQTGTPTFNVWQNMRARCGNTKHDQFRNYGERGITVCQRWHSFENFLADMGPRPVGMTLDRVNNEGNYEPGNCRWATKSEQQRNKRNNILVTYRGETKPIAAWCEQLGLVYDRTHNRIVGKGWTPEEAFNKPSRYAKFLARAESAETRSER